VTLTDGMWKGRPALLVGGGPSLRGLKLSWVNEALLPISLDDFRDGGERRLGHCIAVNRAAEFVNYPDLWLGMDTTYWRKHASAAARCDAPRVWIDHGERRPDVDVVLPCAAPPGTPNRHSALAWGRSLAEGVGCAGNSGFAALNLADVLGADPIYLLGFDMKGEGGVVTHFHDGYAEKAPEDSLCDRWLEAFRWASKQVRARVVVLEVSPGDSRLDCFEKRPAGDVL
jgi:hypothetical protein